MCIHIYRLCSVTQSWPALQDSMDCSPPGSSVHGISQARILEWVAVPFSRDLLDTGMETVSPESLALAGRFFTTEPPGKSKSSHEEKKKFFSISLIFYI